MQKDLSSMAAEHVADDFGTWLSRLLQQHRATCQKQDEAVGNKIQTAHIYLARLG